MKLTENEQKHARELLRYALDCARFDGIPIERTIARLAGMNVPTTNTPAPPSVEAKTTLPSRVFVGRARRRDFNGASVDGHIALEYLMKMMPGKDCSVRTLCRNLGLSQSEDSVLNAKNFIALNSDARPWKLLSFNSPYMSDWCVRRTQEITAQ